MPEYLAPRVFVEETGSDEQRIRGVPTSTAGFLGPCRFGPVGGPPTQVTSFEDFRQAFGALDDLVLGGVRATNHVAHAVRAFFLNGGTRAHVARVFQSEGTDAPDGHTARSRAIENVLTPDAFRSTGGKRLSPRFVARYPGREGNVTAVIRGLRGDDLRRSGPPDSLLARLRPGDVVEVSRAGPKGYIVSSRPGDPDAIAAKDLHHASADELGGLTLRDAKGVPLDLASLPAHGTIQPLTLTVTVDAGGPCGEEHAGLSTSPLSSRFLPAVLGRHARDNGARVAFDLGGDPADGLHPDCFSALFVSLVAAGGNGGLPLEGGADGAWPSVADYVGGGSGATATGLSALAEVDEIAVLCAPGSSAHPNLSEQHAVRAALIAHCEAVRHRFAILSADQAFGEAAVRDARSQHDCSRAALYFPWVTIHAPSGETLNLPPDGFVAGLYARIDAERGVHRAPAGEVLRGVEGLSQPLSDESHHRLALGGVNCLRTRGDRGIRVWGARTLSASPTGSYVNVSRFLIYLERSIEEGLHWVVFEPNGEPLWASVRRQVTSFLFDTWRAGALSGDAPDRAYFVRCDRSTMTQADLDRGRLILLVGAAPTRPGEFILFRVHRWTADAP